MRESTRKVEKEMKGRSEEEVSISLDTDNFGCCILWSKEGTACKIREPGRSWICESVSLCLARVGVSFCLPLG